MPASESNGCASEMITSEHEHAVENFIPMTTSTPLSCLRGLSDLDNDSTHGGGDTYYGDKNFHLAQSVADGEETIGAFNHISAEMIPNEKLDVLEVESMDMSNSCSTSPVASPNQQSSVGNETSTTNATRLIFQTAENTRCRSEFPKEGLETDADKSVNQLYVDTADMDISFGEGQVSEESVATEFKKLPVAFDVTNEPTDILFGTSGGDIALNSVEKNIENEACLQDKLKKGAETSDHEELKNIVMIDNIQIADNALNMESLPAQGNDTYDVSMKLVHNADGDIHFASNAALELSSQVDREHISSEFLSSVRKVALESPAVLPKKKIRLVSPKVILPPKTSALLFGSPRIGSPKITPTCVISPSDKIGSGNTSENAAITDKSTDEVLNEIKHRLRRSLNNSGVFTLTELSAADGDNIGMLYDIPMPEPLFHSNELSSQVSTAVSFNGEVHTAGEQSYIESSSLSSRRSEIVTAALEDESSFLTSRVDTVGFNINFQTIPCLRIKPSEQPQIVELKQLATTNLRKRIAEVVDKCKGLINAQLPDCGNRKIAECIRTLNPRKLSRKEASWFDVCYLMAQHEWFVLRAKLAKLTSEKLDELLLETKAESEQKKHLIQSVIDCRQNHDEVMERFGQLKLLDEAADSEAQNEMKIEELQRMKRVRRLEIAQKKLELAKKQGARLAALLKEYHETKSAVEELAAKKAARRVQFLQKYEEDIAEYRDLLAGASQKN
uniref:Uncharacterized protein n=1 Tax=Setaria digitata TaxID=48799 RepID=A0A915PYD3_9BILA